MSWFEVGIGQKADQGHKWKTHNNEIASKNFREHIGIEFGPDHPIWKEVRPGDRLSVWAVAIYPGWACFIRAAELRVRTFYDPGYMRTKKEAVEHPSEASKTEGVSEGEEQVEEVTSAVASVSVKDTA